ncbi:MAG: DUF4011 domain-containing protein [Clostridiales bacterium]|nr:DUF4011 domain-containing protein [Clostridiales bacterium]
MDTKKLDKWADLLLDTGKRNNLVNFRDTRASSVEVLLPSPDTLFEKIDGSISFEVFDPKIDEEENELDAVAEDGELSLHPSASPGEKNAYLSQYANRIKRKNQMLLYNAAANPIATVKNIDKKARTFIEETGVNVAYMAFGFIHWKESESSHQVFRAPILLIPILLEQASAVEPYFIKSSEDDVILNPTFAYKLDAEYGIELPSYNEEGLSDYLKKIEKLVSKLHWTVTSECKISIFSFLKINMYRDLKDNAATILSNQNVRKLLGETTDSENMERGSEESATVSDPLVELHSVVDADSSQIEAIEMAKSGKSFVLQGPPGTGKSQTITNIIAECLSDGKKILFVSEKSAALNIVYDKLSQAGLSEFCLELHSHKTSKKKVIDNICHTLRTGRSVVSSKADGEIALKEKAKQQLDAYAFELHKQQPVIEKILYQLYEVFAALRLVPDVDWIIPGLAEKGESYARETVPLLEQYVDYIASVGYDYRKNAWYGYVKQDMSYQTKAEVKSNLSLVVEMLRAIVPLSQTISEMYGVDCSNVDSIRKWQKFFSFASQSLVITPALLKEESLEVINSVLDDLQLQSAELISCCSELDTVF